MLTLLIKSIMLSIIMMSVIMLSIIKLISWSHIYQLSCP
jgi:hypothetical protein